MTSGRNRKGGDELLPGQMVLGRYRVERLLDEGGMASIYLAQDLQTQSVVAIKCLYRIYTSSDVVRARFIDEGRIQMMLQHPNIVRVHQFVEQPTLAFVMEYVHGPTLEDLLTTRGVMSMTEVLEIMVPVLSALGLAHSRHIIHRDLKPSNILLYDIGGEWHPKVMDFGVAKLKRTKNLTATGTTVGTLHYMSPEQIVGSKGIDGRADIYSLGITLYKLCTGDVPFNAATEFALMMAQVEAPPHPPSALNPSISPEFEQVILKALAKRPEARYQNVKEFTSALLSLRDAHGKETIDTINIPSFLLDYAMMADQVAVDRTEEIMVRSRTHDEMQQPEQVFESGETQEHVRRTLPIPQDEDDASTIEIDSMRLDHFRSDDRVNSTLDMNLDPTAQSRISSTTLDQLVRESEQRVRAARGEDHSGITQDSSVSEWDTTPLSDALEHTEEDRTVPIRLKTMNLPDAQTTTRSVDHPRIGPMTSPPRGRDMQDPTHRHTPMFNARVPGPPTGQRPSSLQGPRSTIPPGASARPNPFDAPCVSELPPVSIQRVSHSQIDTSERTIPFSMTRDSEPELLQTADSGEHYAPTITADQLLPEQIQQMPMSTTKPATNQYTTWLLFGAALSFVGLLGVILIVWAFLG